MSKKIKEFLNNLKTALLTLDNVKLFGAEETSYKEIEYSCVQYLKFIGYKVAKRPEFKTIIKIEDLVTYFYTLMDYYHSEFCSLTSSRKKDIAIISNFVNYRKDELGCSTTSAINECALIITTIIQNEKELGLDRQIGIWVFGTAKCKWITDKAISLLNDNYTRQNEAVVYAKAQLFAKQHTNESLGYDIKEIKKRRKLDA